MEHRNRCRYTCKNHYPRVCMSFMRRACLASLIGQMTRNVAAKNDRHLVYKMVLGKKTKKRNFSVLDLTPKQKKV